MTRQAQHTCNGCGNAATFRCTACRRVYYCSQQCQKRDWSTHKLLCKQLASNTQDTCSNNAYAHSTGQQVQQLSCYPVPPACPKPSTQSCSILTKKPSGRRLHAALQAAAAVTGNETQAPEPSTNGSQTSILHTPVEDLRSKAARHLEGSSSQNCQLGLSLVVSAPLQSQDMRIQNEPIVHATLVPRPPPGNPPRCQLQADGSLCITQAATLPTARPYSRPTPFLRSGFLNSAKVKVEKQTATENSSLQTASASTSIQTGSVTTGVTQVISESPATCRFVWELPHDLLSLILGLLPARSLGVAAQVCKDWCQVSKQPHLWARHVTELGIVLPNAWLKQGRTRLSRTCPEPRCGSGTPGCTSINVHQNLVEIVRLSPTPPPTMLQDNHLVAGFQSLRALRAARSCPRPTEHSQHRQPAACSPLLGSGDTTSVDQSPNPMCGTTSACLAGQPPGLHIAVATALKQRANWHSGRYAEYRQHNHTAAIECMAFTTTKLWGATLVTAGWDGAVHVYAMYAPTGKTYQQQSIRQPLPTARQWHQLRELDNLPGSQACNEQQQRLFKWKIGCSTGLEPVHVRSYQGHAGWITCMAAGQEYVITGATDKRLVMWAHNDPGPSPTAVVIHTAGVTAVKFAYSECETMAVAGCSDGSIHVWDMLSKQRHRLYSGHTDAVWGLHHLPNYGLISSSRDGTLRIWQLPMLQKKRCMLGQDAVFAIHAPDKQQLAQSTTTPLPVCRQHDDVVHEASQWMDVVETRTTMQAAMQSGRHYEVHCLQPGVITSQRGSLHKSTASSFRITSTLQLDTNEMTTDNAVHVLQAHVPVVLCMDVYEHTDTAHPSNPSHGVVAAEASTPATGNTSQVLVATGGADGLVQVWDVTNFATDSVIPQCTLRGHMKGVLSVKFGWLPEIMHQPAHCQPKTLTGSNKPTVTKMPHTVAQGMHDSARQRLVLLSGSVGVVKVWDPLSAMCLQTLKDHTGPVTSILVSHNYVVTMAMNDGLYVYAAQCTSDAGVLMEGQTVLVPVSSLLDGTGLQLRFGAAVAVCPQALAVGSSTGECIILDYSCPISVQV